MHVRACQPKLQAARGTPESSKICNNSELAKQVIGDQIPYRPGGWVLHQPPWSFGFDSQTRGTRKKQAHPVLKYRVPHGSQGASAVMARRRRRRPPGGQTTAAGSGRRRAPFSTDTASHTHTTRSLAPYSPFPPRRAHSPTAFSGPMARPARAPCSHPETGPPDSATSPVLVLYSRILCACLCVLALPPSPARAPCSHPQPGPPDSATVIVLYSRALCARLCVLEPLSPALAPCSHPQPGPPDSATSPVIVLY